MNVWSEKNKVVNVLDPVATAFATAVTDIVNMENYNKCTFIVATGASVANTDSTLTVLAGISNALPFFFIFLVLCPLHNLSCHQNTFGYQLLIDL